MSKATTICLITPGHLASTPRLVKEADSLDAAGYSVHVVSVDHYPPVRPLDDEILASRKWKCHRLRSGGRLVRRFQAVCRVFAQKAFPLTHSPALAIWAHQPMAFSLARIAKKNRADLYLGHCIGGLAASGLAAGSAAKLGFDAEDFHRVETEAKPNSVIVALETHWLPKCHHRTAASPLISAAYAEACRIPAPAVVLNVFPLAEAPRKQPVTPQLPNSLYWFSQTVGPGRGLESLVEALGAVRATCSLHLRGIPAAGYADALQSHARSCGYGDRIHFEPVAPAAEMARLASQYAAGLSLEQSTPPNRDLCLTNKIFTYLLAGIPTILTPTSAQQRLAAELGDAAVCVDWRDRSASGRAIVDFIDPIRREKAAVHAWRLAQTRFNWDAEQQTFLKSIQVALQTPP